MIAPLKGGRAQTQLKAGMSWNYKPLAVMRYLRDQVIWQDDERRHWLMALVNHDVRELLSLIERLLRSPALYQDRVLRYYATDEPFGAGLFFAIVLKPIHHYFQESSGHLIFNVFDRHIDGALCPLAPVMVLQALSDGRYQGPSAADGFLEVEALLNLAEAAMRIPRAFMRELLAWLRSAGLIETYDPSASEVEAHVRITPRGELHVRWAKERLTFSRELAVVHSFAHEAAAKHIAALDQSRQEAFRNGNEEQAREWGREIAKDYVMTLTNHLDLSALAHEPRLSGVVALIEAMRQLVRSQPLSDATDEPAS